MIMGARGGSDNRGTVLQGEMSQVRFPMLFFGFVIGLILSAAQCP